MRVAALLSKISAPFMRFGAAAAPGGTHLCHAAACGTTSQPHDELEGRYGSQATRPRSGCDPQREQRRDQQRSDAIKPQPASQRGTMPSDTAASTSQRRAQQKNSMCAVNAVW
jgi:hypothetical protein